MRNCGRVGIPVYSGLFAVHQVHSAVPRASRYPMPTVKPMPRLQPRLPWSLLIVGIGLYAITPCAWAGTVWVITDHEHPVRTIPSARVVELDEPARLLASLSAQLPRDPTEASAVVRRRLRAGGIALQDRLAVAYQGVTDAWSIGVTKIPAVVVDGHYVVYGIPDVDRALRLVDQYRRTPR